MTYKYRERKVKSVGDLIKALEAQLASSPTVWFRGQADSDWDLTPSLARRPELPAAEAALIKRFKQNALPHLAQRPQSEWEWLFLMQHYRLPTRLLDWTESPLVGLYFAVADKSAAGKAAALWCLDPIALNASANIKFDYAIEIPGFGHDEILDNYLPSKIAKEHTSMLGPIAGIAARNSPRIAAQMGAFTVTHREPTAINAVGNKSHVWRLVIPPESKDPILAQLASLRVSPLSLFPELDKVAEAAMEVVP
jgi:hypothetical protein